MVAGAVIQFINLISMIVLTTFKSDFKKIFNNTPGKWLTKKRLNLAHHKLNIEKQ